MGIVLIHLHRHYLCPSLNETLYCCSMAFVGVIALSLFNSLYSIVTSISLETMTLSGRSLSLSYRAY